MTVAPGSDLPAGGGLAWRWSRTSVPFAVLRMSGQGAEFVGWVLLARRLGAAGFGHLAIAFLISRYAGLVGDWGAALRGPRDIARDPGGGGVRSLLRHRAQVTVTLTVAFVVVAVVSGHRALAPMAVTILARGLNRDWIALGRERGVRASVPSVVQGAALAVIAVVVATEGSAAVGLAVAYGAAGALSIALNPVERRRRPGDTRVDAWIMSATIGDQVLTSADTLVLGAMRGAREAGIYAAVYRVPNAWMTVTGLLSAGLIPMMTQLATKDPIRFRQFASRTIRTGFLCGIALMCTAPLAMFAVPRVFGPEYRPGVTPAVILLVSAGLGTLPVPYHPILLAYGRDRFVAVLTISVAAVNVAANLAVVPRFGMAGAAWVTVASELIALGFVVREDRRLRALDPPVPRG